MLRRESSAALPGFADTDLIAFSVSFFSQKQKLPHSPPHFMIGETATLVSFAFCIAFPGSTTVTPSTEQTGRVVPILMVGGHKYGYPPVGLHRGNRTVTIPFIPFRKIRGNRLPSIAKEQLSSSPQYKRLGSGTWEQCLTRT